MLFRSAGTWSLGDATVDFSQTLNKETTGTEANGDAITSEPVSYTHLDVYKRQVQHPTSFLLSQLHVNIPVIFNDFFPLQGTDIT